MENDKKYSESDLNELSINDILEIIPQNICINRPDGCTDFIASFVIGKIIDGSFYIQYRENHRDKALKDQKVAYENWYVTDIKQGLILALLWHQQQEEKTKS